MQTSPDTLSQPKQSAMPHRLDCREPWQAIVDPDCSLLIETRISPLSAGQASVLLAQAPYCRRAQGDISAIEQSFQDLPDNLQADIAELGRRFMAVMQVDAIRVRFEGVTTNACRKMHADFTDLRLITSYAGPGTQYAPHGEGDCCIENVPTGSIALFKGKLFGAQHAPCFHRSPPVEGTGQARLVLVIDTLEKDEFHTV